MVAVLAAALMAVTLGSGASWAAPQRPVVAPTPTAENSSPPSAAAPSIAAFLTAVAAYLAEPPAQVRPGHPDGPLRVVVFGDSVPSGAACDCTPFGELVAQRLGTLQGRPVEVDNLAVGGSASDDVVDLLRQPSVRDEVAHAELVIVQTGANDLSEDDAYRDACRAVKPCYGGQLARTDANICEAVGTIRALQSTPGAQTVVLGYWNVFLDGQVGRGQGSTYVAVSDALSRALNADIARIAADVGALAPDSYAPFKGASGRSDATPYLASDGDHPNAAGHRLLADAVLDGLGDTAAIL